MKFSGIRPGPCGGRPRSSCGRVWTGTPAPAAGRHIRLPASLCGVYGLKPTFGRVSTAGVFPLSKSLDHVGPMANNVDDLFLLLAGICALDETVLEPERIIVPRGYFLEEC